MYDIYFDLNDMHQTVDSSDDGDEFWLMGEPFTIELDDDYAVIKPPKKTYENGCYCTQCGELFPYAEPNQADGSLICYSCRRFVKK